MCARGRGNSLGHVCSWPWKCSNGSRSLIRARFPQLWVPRSCCGAGKYLKRLRCLRSLMLQSEALAAEDMRWLWGPRTVIIGSNSLTSKADGNGNAPAAAVVKRARGGWWGWTKGRALAPDSGGVLQRSKEKCRRLFVACVGDLQTLAHRNASPRRSR